jgi:predicted RNA binding protein YcfA (HicA-like mRNA interferase family)
MKARDVIRALEADGRSEARSKGSHRHFRHPTKPGTVTVPGCTSSGDTVQEAATNAAEALAGHVDVTLDAAATAEGMSRSGFIAQAVRDRLRVPAA